VTWATYVPATKRIAGLGANPIEFVHHYLGVTAINLLLLTLAVTPAAQIFQQPFFGQYRRLIGLFSFFYAFLHLATYVALDQFFDWHSILTDILKRPYISIGVLAIISMLPLAITSTSGWVKRLGASKWRQLHRLSYIAGFAACLHFFLMQKGFQIEPIIYFIILISLLLYRLIKSQFLKK